MTDCGEINHHEGNSTFCEPIPTYIKRFLRLFRGGEENLGNDLAAQGSDRSFRESYKCALGQFGRKGEEWDSLAKLRRESIPEGVHPEQKEMLLSLKKDLLDFVNALHNNWNPASAPNDYFQDACRVWTAKLDDIDKISPFQLGKALLFRQLGYRFEAFMDELAKGGLADSQARYLTINTAFRDLTRMI